MTATITRQDLVPLSTYRDGRDQYLQKMIKYKTDRRIKLADHISLLFENKNTVLFQIQELVHSEDLSNPSELDEYIDIYSGMLPGENELSATLFIELDNQKLLEELLVKLKGIEHHLTLHVGSESLAAVFEEVHDDREFTTSVHYLKFPLTAQAKKAIQDEPVEQADVRLKLSHPQLKAEVKLSPQNIASLQKDLA